MPIKMSEKTDSMQHHAEETHSGKLCEGGELSAWTECRLADAPFEIIDGDRGANYPKQDEFSQNGYCLFLNAKNVTLDGFVFDACCFISKEKDQILRKGKLQRNDIVLTTRGTVGNIGFYNDSIPYENIRLNSGMVIIRPDPTRISPEYTHQLFKYLKGDFEVFATGSAQPQLPIRDLKEILILLPPLQEQRSIAAVLSSLDEKIDLLHRQNKTLEGMASALWRKMFVEEVGTEWETTTIWEVATINGQNIDKEYVFAEIEYLDTGSITEGRISGYQQLQLKDAPNRAKRIVQKNDIVISMVRPIQKHYGILKKVNPNTIVSTGFVVVSCLKIDPHFVYVLLTQKEMTEHLDIIAEASTTTYPSLAPSDIAKIDFPMPPTNLLEQFSEYAGHVWDKIEENNSQIRILSKTRDTLLPKLMSGEVSIKG